MVEKALSKRDKSALALLLQNNDSHVRGVKILQNEYLKKGLPENLTKREQDVATACRQRIPQQRNSKEAFHYRKHCARTSAVGIPEA